MSDEIVKRLRGSFLPNDTLSIIRDEAADEIERLRKELQETEGLLDIYRREDMDRSRWEGLHE